MRWLDGINSMGMNLGNFQEMGEKGKPGVLQSMRLGKFKHNLVTNSNKIFSITCYSFYISTHHFTLLFMEMASFLKPHKPTFASFKLFCCSFFMSLSFHRTEES